VNLDTPTTDEWGQRLDRLESALGRLTDEVARQAAQQASLQGHLADLSQVMAQHGLEIEDRLALVEMMLEELAFSDQDPSRGGMVDVRPGPGGGTASSLPGRA
jgi:vacuolar-type H+-ATPase subunit B/Vma2